MSRRDRTKADSAGRQQPPFWDRLSEGWQHAVCLSALFVVSLSLFASIHFGGETLIGSDTVNWRADAESVLEYERETGNTALWATNVFGGMPAYMISYRTVVPQADTVFNLLRRVFWPSSHFLVLLSGMYLLVFFLSRDKWAGVVAAIAFGLTTYIPVLLVAGHNSKFVALCYAPWLLLAFVFALRRPGLVASLLFAIVLAIHLRAGHFQITYYMLVIMLVWWLAEGVRAWRSKSVRSFVGSTLTLVGGGVMAVLMVAQPYLAQYEYKAYTVRGSAPGGGAGGLDWDYAMGWSQGIGELVTLVIADAYGGSDLYWGAKAFTGGPHYVTALVAFLAVVGALRYRSVAARALGISGILILLFSLGSNLELVNRPMFNFFPLFAAFRVPETWLAAFALVSAVLAGLGLNSLITDPPSMSLKTSTVARGFVGLVVVLVVMVVSGGPFFSFERAGEHEEAIRQIARGNQVSPDDPRVARAADQYIERVRAERRGRFTSDGWRAIVALLAFAGAFAVYRRGRLPATAVQLASALIILIDLWGVDRRYLNDSKLTRSPDAVSAIPEYAFDRFILDQKASDEPFRVLSLEGSPTTTARPSYYHESLSGYHGAKLRLYQDYLDRMLITPDGRLNIEALRLMNTRYVVARTPVPEATQVFSDGQTGFNVYEINDYLPRAFFVDSVAVVDSSEEMWDRIADAEFDPGAIALTEEDLGVAPARADTASRPTASVTSYAPDRIDINVETDQRRLLVVSEVFYPAGWRATIDGDRAKIYRVDYLLRGVIVAAGQHKVELRFEPRSHFVGVWVSAISSILVYGLVVLLIGRRVIRSRSDGDDTLTG